MSRKSWANFLSRFGPLLGLVVVYAIFVFMVIIGRLGERFLSLDSLENIARQTAVVGIAALGMTLVIIGGGIDLSVGSIVALSSVVVASRLEAGSVPIVAACWGVLAGALCGLISGTIITRLKVVSFIVTLGMLGLVRGVAKGLAHDQKIDAPITWLNSLLAKLGPDQRWMLVPPGVWLLVILALLTAGILRYTKFGRHTIAVGSNEETARLCGVPVDRVKLAMYTLCAGFAGVAGLMQFSRLTVGSPTEAAGLELNVIAAVVIGGGSLSGGEGSVLGTIVGALIMSVIKAGCIQMGLPTWVQEIVTGIIIVLAVALDRMRHRWSE
jgi:ribose transport system permease protein